LSDLSDCTVELDANGASQVTIYKDLLAIAFFWDTSFSCIGAREFDPMMCQQAIEWFVDNASPRGRLPGTLCDTHRADKGQAVFDPMARLRLMG
jgi:hypothetical protein